MIETIDHAAEVADAVAVGVRERPNVDLVQDALAPPGGIVVRHQPSMSAAGTLAHYPSER